jgi:cobalt/nickel transport system ATP-binding protein
MSVAIAVNNLKFVFPDGTRALAGVSFTVEDQECVGLVGPNGSGKSTLLLHLNGILPERHDGTNPIAINGTPVSSQNLLQIRRTVGVLFQDPDDQLFCPTVYEDVAFGPLQFGMAEQEVHAAVADALTKVGLQGFENRSPHHLSGGEKQRVCLAGILVCRPHVLALDEPTSNLDPRGKRELKALIRSIPVTKIIASHDLELIVELCCRVIILDRGTVVADGPTRELLSNEDLMIRHGLEKPHILQHQHPHASSRK